MQHLEIAYTQEEEDNDGIGTIVIGEGVENVDHGEQPKYDG